MSPDRLDPAMGEGGWNEWRFLVLHEIRRLTDGFERVDEKLDTVLRQQDEDRHNAFTTAETLARELREYKEVTAKQIATINDTLHSKESGVVPRVGRIETGSVVSEAVKQYRGWIITTGIFLVVSVALPIAKFIMDVT